MKVVDHVTDLIGRTPMVRLNKVIDGSPHKFFAKIECLNPGGSVKDRIALSIIENAEKRGELKPGSTIVEATSGNTGVGLSFVAAVKGYKCICVMPEKMSDEKRAILTAYGAKVVITPTNVAPEDPRSHYSIAKKLVDSIPGAFYANQFHNTDNYNTHIQTTGPELWEQTNGQIDMFVAGAGTGGTISGVGEYLKGKKPGVKIVCGDPIGSILNDLFYHGKVVEPPGSYLVEGIGEDMLPGNMHFQFVDDFVQVNDRDAFDMTRRLVTEEGLCMGPSSGLALVAALRYSAKLTKPSTVVVLFPDSGRSYLSKAFNEKWLLQNNLIDNKDLSKSFNRVITAKDYSREAGWEYKE